MWIAARWPRHSEDVDDVTRTISCSRLAENNPRNFSQLQWFARNSRGDRSVQTLHKGRELGMRVDEFSRRLFCCCVHNVGRNFLGIVYLILRDNRRCSVHEPVSVSAAVTSRCSIETGERIELVLDM